MLFSVVFFFFKQKTAYEVRISDWSSDVCSSDLDIDPSPITAIARPGWSLSLFATAKPSAALIEVDECAAPKGSYSLSLRLVKPDSPPPVLSVRIRSRRPVTLLCG